MLAIVSALFCLIGLLFLLMKEEVTTGYAEGSVRAGDIYHKTQIPISKTQQVTEVRQLVSKAQRMAMAALAARPNR